MRKEAPLSQFKRKDGMISLEHCQEWIFVLSVFLIMTRYLHFNRRCYHKNAYFDLTPIGDILVMSWSVFCGQKIHIHIFASNDVIHRYFFLLYVNLKPLE